jgi:TolA-binding protein
MKTRIKIITISFAVLLMGCGVNKEDHQKAVNELSQANRQLQVVTDEASSLRTQIAEANDRISNLTSEIDHLKKQEAYAFSEAGKLLDSGDTSGALRAYEAFVRDFPESSRISSARSQIELISQRLEAQKRDEAARAQQEAEEHARQELAANLRTGMLTVPQLIPCLRGKTKDEVSDLLGPPSEVLSEGNELLFYDKAYSTIKRSNNTILKVKFYNGIVYSVGLNGEEEYSTR